MSTENYISYLIEKAVNDSSGKDDNPVEGQKSTKQIVVPGSGIQGNEVGSASKKNQSQSQFDSLIPSSGHFPSQKPMAGFFPYQHITNTKQLGHPFSHAEPIRHPDPHQIYLQPPIFQHNYMFNRPPQTTTFIQPGVQSRTKTSLNNPPIPGPLPYRPMNRAMPPGGFQIQEKTGNQFPPTNKPPGWFIPPQRPPQVFPVSDPIPASSLQIQQQQQRKPVIPSQTNTNLPSCQYAISESVELGPGVNPFIHFDPTNPMHKPCTQTDSSTMEPVLKPLDKEGTKSGLGSQNDNATGDNISKIPNRKKGQIDNVTVDEMDVTGHVDVIGDTMFLRIDENIKNITPLDNMTVETHKCSKCDSVFNTSADFAQHLRQVHFQKTQQQTKRLENMPPNLFKCDFCGGEFFFDSDLIHHQQTVHLRFIQERLEEGLNNQAASFAPAGKEPVDANVKRTVKSVATNQINPENVSENSAKDLLRKKLNSQQGVKKKIHDHIVKKQATITCKNPQDSLIFADSGTSIDHENTWLCSLCSDTFKARADFNNHMKAKHSENTEVSTKETSESADLNEQANLWKCKICGGNFFFESDLKDHEEKVHNYGDVVDNVGESIRNELIVKLAMEQQRSAQYGRVKAKVWMPSDYVYYGTGTDLDKNGGNVRGWRQQTSLVGQGRGRGRGRGRGWGRGTRQTTVFREDEMYTETGGSSLQNIAHIHRDGNRGSRDDHSHSTRSRSHGRGTRTRGQGRGRGTRTRGQGQGRGRASKNQYFNQKTRIRGWGRGRGRPNKKQYFNQKTNEDPYESTESDIEIIEEPKVVIEIDDKDGSPKKSKNDPKTNNLCNELDKNILNQSLLFYCGLCAFKCQSDEVLDRHMERHSLEGEISQVNDKLDEDKLREMIGDKYLAVEVERLNLNSGPVTQNQNPAHQVKKHLGKKLDELQATDKETEKNIDIENLLQQAGLSTLSSKKSCLPRRNLKARLSKKDILALKKHKIKDVCISLYPLKDTNIDKNLNIKHRKTQVTNEWLKSFQDANGDESDIEWDIPESVSYNLGEGYEADDDDISDIIPIHGQEKSQLINGKHHSSVHNASKITSSFLKKSTLLKEKTKGKSKNENSVVTNENIDNETVEKRMLRSNKSNIDKDANRCKRRNRSDISAEHLVPGKVRCIQTDSQRSKSRQTSKNILKKYRIREPKICLQRLDSLKNKVKVADKSLLNRYGIKESNVCLSDIGKSETETVNKPKIKLEREDSGVFDISQTSWWNEKKVKDKIDFSRTPIVPLKRIDTDDVVIVSVESPRVKRGRKQTAIKSCTSMDRLAKLTSKVSTHNRKRNTCRTDSKSDITDTTKNRRSILKSTGKSKFTQSSRKQVSPEKKEHTPVKKSTRLMELDCSTKRKALQKAITLIRHDNTKRKCVIQKSKKILQIAKNIKTKNSQNKTINIQRENKACRGMGFRKFEEKNKKLLTVVREKDCEVSLPVLSDSDIQNWKQKETMIENKLKEQMFKLLTPKKLKAAVIVEKLPEKSLAGECMDYLVAVAKDMAKKNLTSEFSLGLEICQNTIGSDVQVENVKSAAAEKVIDAETKVKQQMIKPFSQAKDMAEVVVEKVLEKPLSSPAQSMDNLVSNAKDMAEMPLASESSPESKICQGKCSEKIDEQDETVLSVEQCTDSLIAVAKDRKDENLMKEFDPGFEDEQGKNRNSPERAHNNMNGSIENAESIEENQIKDGTFQGTAEKNMEGKV